jgi:hypothetical protein
VLEGAGRLACRFAALLRLADGGAERGERLLDRGHPARDARGRFTQPVGFLPGLRRFGFAHRQVLGDLRGRVGQA